MSDPQIQPTVDPRAVQRPEEQHSPLVWAVCRRYLRRVEDVQDAVQETFLRLARQCQQRPPDSPAAWLAATANTVSVHLIRRAVRERRRREQLALIPPPHLQRRALHEVIGQRLHATLLSLSSPQRELIVHRFIRKQPLREIARRQRTSIATASRHVAAALGELADVLRGMG